MVNQEHLTILNEGVEAWNEWREHYSTITPDLSAADLEAIDLHGANLRQANLSNANLSYTALGEANLTKANLQGANLFGAHISRALVEGANLQGADLRELNGRDAYLFRANLSEARMNEANFVDAYLRGARLVKADLRNSILGRANLSDADLSGADLRDADLGEANLREANLSNAKLMGANLAGAQLIATNLTRANLSGCRVFGLSAWKLNLEETDQSDLIVTDADEPVITVDDLEIAQFMYLLLNNKKIRSVLDTITTKAVLILGRFTPERKAVLDAIRDELRNRNYIPILFDFEKPANRDLTETVMTLASLSRFVIADLSDPNSIPHELMTFADKLLSVPVQGIFSPVKEHPNPYPMYEHLRRLPHVLPIYKYQTPEELIASLEENVIKPAEEKVKVVRPTPLN